MTVTIEQAQAWLPELIAKLAPGEEVTITRDAKPVAQLVHVSGEKSQPRFGSCRGKLIILAEDDEHLEDFKDYMP
jgi:antitoxin (DNA-binding transcriptional repressor) of toxin-antitoxin stability system